VRLDASGKDIKDKEGQVRKKGFQGNGREYPFLMNVGMQEEGKGRVWKKGKGRFFFREEEELFVNPKNGVRGAGGVDPSLRRMRSFLRIEVTPKEGKRG